MPLFGASVAGVTRRVARFTTGLRAAGLAAAVAATLGALAWAMPARASVFPLAGETVPADTMVVRARADLAANVGAQMELRINGRVIGQQEVRAVGEMASYRFSVGRMQPGARVELVFTNDGVVNGADRNLYIGAVAYGGQVQLPFGPQVTFDRGSGAAAFDGLDLVANTGGSLFWGGALRITWPRPDVLQANAPAQVAAARLLMQGGFGPTEAALAAMAGKSASTWVAEQMALPFTPDFVTAVQARYAQGADQRPGGSRYTNAWVAQRFWQATATAPDVLRKRVAFALHQVFMVSQLDSNLWFHTRAYAHYLDTLNRLAFGNFRTLMEEMALSPVMGIYLSHMRNAREDTASGRQPDENFARELMQLFTIGLVELNADGTPRLDGQGRTIPTYTQADVAALARVFTGWSWGLPDNQLTDQNFRWGGPRYSAAEDTQADLNRMKPYPGQHSPGEKRLFTGKPWAVTIPAGTAAPEALRIALDTLFQHPNVGPFIGRQLIQRLVTSAPSPGYVARVAAAFADNGRGQRGDMAAVVRAVLLDDEARKPPVSAQTTYGKLREPVLRTALALRALGGTSASGEFMMAHEGGTLSQQALFAPSVFGYTRPGFVPPQTAFAAMGATAPEFQLVSETTVAQWVNFAQALADWGVGWNGTRSDVRLTLDRAASFIARGDAGALLTYLDTLLYAGTMSPALKNHILDAMQGVGGQEATHHLSRARVAVFLALASPQFLAQR